MNNYFKLNQKVLTEHGPGRIVNLMRDDIEPRVVVKLDNGINIGILIGRDFMKLNSAHDKLLELGYHVSVITNFYVLYKKTQVLEGGSELILSILIDLIEKTYETYKHPYNCTDIFLMKTVSPIDLQLSKVLTEYLDELCHEEVYYND